MTTWTEYIKTWSINFHYPFKKSSFGVLLKQHSHGENLSGAFLSDIELYHQPVPDPTIAIFFAFLRLLLIIIGLYVHFRLLVLIKEENGLVHDVARLYVYVNMFFWPFWFLFTTSTDLIHPLNQVIGQWYCTLGWFILYLSWTTTAFHSFIVSIMRYFCIVHQKRVELFGIERFKKLFFIFSFTIPVFVVIWAGIEGSEFSHISNINKCNNKHHMAFLIDTSSLNVFKRNFCEFDTYSYSGYLRRISCIAKTTVTVIMGFNFSEAIVYYRIFVYITG